jgi:CBS domain-containing protein
MRLGDIMTTDVAAAEPGEPAEQAFARMRARGIHHLVVMDGRKVAGVVSASDLGGPNGRPARVEKTVGELMTRHFVAVDRETTVRRAANLLRGRAVSCLPVVEAGRLCGIVTVSDLLELIGRGVERPVVRSKRWTLRHRAERRRAPPPPPWSGSR